MSTNNKQAWKPILVYSITSIVLLCSIIVQEYYHKSTHKEEKADPEFLISYGFCLPKDTQKCIDRFGEKGWVMLRPDGTYRVTEK
jgi:hypothetical protein